MKQRDIQENYTQDRYVRLDNALGWAYDEETGLEQRVSFKVKLELRENYSFDS
jgi:hypothetical protein